MNHIVLIFSLSLYSWDEMQKFDLPAMIDYVLAVTEQQQLHYVGHSQGTLVAFAGFSTNQELAKKVKELKCLTFNNLWVSIAINVIKRS